ncbi:hypothetical protein H5410_005585, partial [Solanum commersonii]
TKTNSLATLKVNLLKTQLRKKFKNEIACEEIDRINAFKTTILSKDWQYLWTSINNNVYDNEEYGHSNSLTVHKFISLMDNVLPLLSCSTLKSSVLNFVFRYDDGVSYFPVIDKWLEFTVNKKVEDLRLNIRCAVHPMEHDQPYSLPEDLCRISSILKLKCGNYRILEDCVLNWTYLKSLTLDDLFLRDEHNKQIMSICPQLES